MKFKNIIKISLVASVLAFSMYGCDDESELLASQSDDTRTEDEIAAGDGPATPRSGTLMPGDGVMMQAFYWDVTDGGVWWDNINSKLEDWQDLGVDAIWIPPVSKGESGAYSMGYDPYDYFDFGDYEQKGTTETRFGNKAELTSMIDNAHSKNIAVIEDMVINHNSGGAQEYNRFTNTQTYTSFVPASGKFSRSDIDFHPNNLHASDEGSFGSMPDLDLKQDYVANWMYKSNASIGHYYMNNLKIDGWRFDYVKGYSTSVVSDWAQTLGGFTVGEYYDFNTTLVNNWVNESNAHAFDFPNFNNMRTAFRNGDLTQLNNTALFKVNPDKAVTFVGNHDTEDRSDNNDDFPNANEAQAYAFILTAPGYPCIFYTHYESMGDTRKNQIKKLVKARQDLAAGEWSVVYSDADEFIAKRAGDGNKPGLYLYINNSSTSQSREVTTHWASSNLKDYTGNVVLFTSSDANGKATLSAPANSYAVWTSTTDSQTAFPSQLYVAGSFQDWDPASASSLASVDSPNITGEYYGVLNMSGSQNEFKFIDLPNWTGTIYGDTATNGNSGTLSIPGNNMVLTGPNYYEFYVNLSNNTWHAYTWGIIGNATPSGWDSDTDLGYNYWNGTGYWCSSVALTDGEFKFRANNAWDVNLGDTAGDGTLESGGDNIGILGGSYMILMNTQTNTYQIGNWGVIGSAVPNGWDSSTQMSYSNSTHKWTVTIPLTAGEFKFRFNNAWDINLGGSLSNLTEGGSNIAVSTPGTYTITLDIETPGSYSATIN